MTSEKGQEEGSERGKRGRGKRREHGKMKKDGIRVTRRKRKRKTVRIKQWKKKWM